MKNDVLAVEPVDPATAAFQRLEGEIAVLRRAVENLATEKANIDIPDYSSTLGELAEQLKAATSILETITDKPAMDLTPENMGPRVDQARSEERRGGIDRVSTCSPRADSDD